MTTPAPAPVQSYCGFCDKPVKAGQHLCARCKKVARRT